jgi:TRAP-type C4-dicarboxylate transport system permease small subunit
MAGFRKFLLYFESIAAGVCLIVLLFCVVLEVLSRFVLHLGITWTEEMARFTFIWASLLGASVALERKKLHDIDIVFNYLPEKLKTIVTILIHVLVSLMLCIFLVYGLKLTQVVHMQVSPTLEIRMSYVYVALPFTAFLMLISTLLDFFQNLKTVLTSYKTGVAK